MNLLKDEPYKLLSLIGIAFTIFLITLNSLTGYLFTECVYPFPKAVTLGAEAVTLVLFILSFIFSKRRWLYYLSLEFLVFHCLYNGKIYFAIFLSSILFTLLLIGKLTNKKLNLIILAVIEIGKLALIIPYGTSVILYYGGLTLFALSTISCINLLFQHAYEKKDKNQLDISSFKFTERQLDCIKETVVNNTTIKELAMNHNVSESAIKKDLSHIYSVLGITGKADLKALFIDFKFQ